MCGEKNVKMLKSQWKLGSPPHVRGKVFIDGKQITASGITPACAGKSLASVSATGCFWDHPRMCGEKTKKIP